MRFSTLNDWLGWQETLHPSEIELGLERVKSVFHSLHPETPPFTVITIAGTNGKGSSVAMLESILLQAGYKVGSYTSPHIIHYNERVRLNAQAVSDDQLMTAFERIDQIRGDVSLTYFEFGTLAALDIFYLTRPDVVLLEVGLGGRLDAVNIIDSDIALITTIDIDHTAWLGDNREAIAAEKAGIMRHKIPVIFSGTEMPEAIRQVATKLDANLYVLNEDYQYSRNVSGWSWQDNEKNTMVLPEPMLFGLHQLQNAAGVIKVLKALEACLPVNNQSIRQGLLSVKLPGRFQVFPAVNNNAERVFDVAHNPQAMQQLASNLTSRPVQGKTIVVMGMLADKDFSKALFPLLPLADFWYCSKLRSKRSLSAKKLAESLSQHVDTSRVRVFESIQSAYLAACEISGIDDRIVVTGSFFAVAEVMEQSV